MEKIWLKQYPKGVSPEINPDIYQSIPDVLEKSCQEFATQNAFYSMGSYITYKELDEKSRAFAAFLQNELKLKKGDRFAIMLPNVFQYPVAMLGALRAGLIVVNVNPLYTATEVTHQVNNAGAETILVLSNFANTVQKAWVDTKLKNIIVTSIGDMLPWPKSIITNFVVKYIKRKVPSYDIPHAIEFNQALNIGKDLPFTHVDIVPSDIAFLQYTGGTTGVSKGAILTHRNLLANIAQAEEWFRPIFRPGKEIIVTALPLYHIFSLTANCLFLTKVGGLNILIINPRDIESVINEMSKFKFSVVTGVNTLFNALEKNPRFAKLDFSNLILALGGGMSVHRTVAERWKQITGKPLIEAYGLTETSPCVSINLTDIKEYNGTVGLPVSSTEVCIFDDNGNEMPIGESGEVAVRGPQVMQGYWQNPAETQRVLRKDGWLLTGDIGIVDASGYLHILERKKDMILVSGFNVYPNEIEDVITSMPGIREAAVIAVPDENSGEVPKAYIVREDQSITPEAVVAYCRTKLTGYKIPKHIEFTHELPKTNVGKVMRRALRPENT